MHALPTRSRERDAGLRMHSLRTWELQRCGWGSALHALPRRQVQWYPGRNVGRRVLRVCARVIQRCAGCRGVHALRPRDVPARGGLLDRLRGVLEWDVQ